MPGNKRVANRGRTNGAAPRARQNHVVHSNKAEQQRKAARYGGLASHMGLSNIVENAEWAVKKLGEFAGDNDSPEERYRKQWIERHERERKFKKEQRDPSSIEVQSPPVPPPKLCQMHQLLMRAERELDAEERDAQHDKRLGESGSKPVGMYRVERKNRANDQAFERFQNRMRDERRHNQNALQFYDMQERERAWVEVLKMNLLYTWGARRYPTLLNENMPLDEHGHRLDKPALENMFGREWIAANLSLSKPQYQSFNNTPALPLSQHHFAHPQGQAQPGFGQGGAQPQGRPTQGPQLTSQQFTPAASTQWNDGGQQHQHSQYTFHKPSAQSQQQPGQPSLMAPPPMTHQPQPRVAPAGTTHQLQPNPAPAQPLTPPSPGAVSPNAAYPMVTHHSKSPRPRIPELLSPQEDWKFCANADRSPHPSPNARAQMPDPSAHLREPPPMNLADPVDAYQKRTMRRAKPAQQATKPSPPPALKGAGQRRDAATKQVKFDAGGNQAWQSHQDDTSSDWSDYESGNEIPDKYKPRQPISRGQQG